MAGASLSIRGLEPHLKEALRLRGARHGRSMEAEARAILAKALAEEERPAFVSAFAVLRRHIPEGDGVDLDQALADLREASYAPPVFE